MEDRQVRDSLSAAYDDQGGLLLTAMEGGCWQSLAEPMIRLLWQNTPPAGNRGGRSSPECTESGDGPELHGTVNKLWQMLYTWQITLTK